MRQRHIREFGSSLGYCSVYYLQHFFSVSVAAFVLPSNLLLQVNEEQHTVLFPNYLLGKQTIN